MGFNLEKETELIKNENLTEKVYLNYAIELPKPEEKLLIHEIEKLKEQGATDLYIKKRNELSRNYIKFIIQKAWKNYFRYNKNISFEDFLSEGYIGVLQALEKFDYKNFENEFLTYWDFYISKNMKDLVVQNIGLTNSLFNDLSTLLKQAQEENINLKEISEIDLIKFIEKTLDIKGKNKLMEKTFLLKPLIKWDKNILSLEHPISTSEDNWDTLSFLDTVVNEYDFYEEYKDLEAKKDLVNKIFSIILRNFKFDDKFLNIFKMRFNYLSEDEIKGLVKKYKGIMPEKQLDREKYTLQEIGNVFWVTRERIRQLEKIMIWNIQEDKEIQNLKKLLNL